MEELYISINKEDFGTARYNSLSARADILKSLKSLHNIQIIKKQKNELRRRLKTLLGELRASFDRLEQNMPSPEQALLELNSIREKLQEQKTGEVNKEMGDKKQEQKEKQKPRTKRDEFDEELMEIQEKLNKLNSL